MLQHYIETDQGRLDEADRTMHVLSIGTPPLLEIRGGVELGFRNAAKISRGSFSFESAI
jgi:hypothetical protein